MGNSAGASNRHAVQAGGLRRILFVDDDASLRAAFVRSTSARGFLVDTAAGGIEAMRLATETRYPVVVTDLAMPDMDGVELIRRLHARDPRTLFVVVTGLPAPELPTEIALRDSVVSIVPKPWDVDDLVDTLHRGIRLWEARSSLPPQPIRSQHAERVLLVEDDDADSDLFGRYLAHALEGCVLVREDSLTSALERLERERFDVIVSDMTLPDARGLDAVLRFQTASPDTPLVITSGYEDDALAIEAVQAGAQDFLVKHRLSGGDLVRSIRYAQQRKQSELRLSRLANFDALTGLANRTQFVERLGQAVVRARRREEHFAVMYIDLDGFKAVNDTLGHDAGDALLIEVAKRLEATVRESDLIARLGGDEFAAVMDNLPSPVEATMAAERLLRALARPYGDDAAQAGVTASIGIAFYPDADETVAGLLKAADRAMYEAKRRGRNTYEVYEPTLTRSSLPEVALRTELKRALSVGEFCLHYQPQLDRRGGVCSAEALLRWRRGGGRLLPPAEFLPLLEASTDIVHVGSWVILTAARDLKRWRDSGVPLQRVSVNVSARQLDDDSLVYSVEHALGATGVEPEGLELEVTESAVMQHPERAARVLERLKRLGVRLAMDDFGTGYSSLAHLYRLPFDTVKIDRSFVGDLMTNPKCRAVTRAIIALARELELEIIAEGVETQAQRSFLLGEGCDIFQGHLIGVPAAPELMGRSMTVPADCAPRTVPVSMAAPAMGRTNVGPARKRRASQAG